ARWPRWRVPCGPQDDAPRRWSRRVGDIGDGGPRGNRHPGAFSVTDRTASQEIMKGPSAEAPSFRYLFDTEFSYVWNTLRRLGVHQSDVVDQAEAAFPIVP